MSSFAERLNQAMHKKTCKAVDVTKATGVIASVISRYRSGQHQPTISNVFAIAKYLKVSPEWLLNGSDAPEWTKPSQGTLWDKDKIIGVQEELIRKFKQENEELRQKIKEWENWKAGSIDIHLPKLNVTVRAPSAAPYIQTIFLLYLQSEFCSPEEVFVLHKIAISRFS